MIAICHKCEHRQRPCAGPCACLFDPANPMDILDRAASGICPAGRFEGAPRPQPLTTLNRTARWPLGVRVIARLKRDGEKGIGDTMARLLAGIGGEAYKRLAKRIGIECGCAARQAMLNARYPYETGTIT